MLGARALTSVAPGALIIRATATTLSAPGALIICATATTPSAPGALIICATATTLSARSALITCATPIILPARSALVLSARGPGRGRWRARVLDEVALPHLLNGPRAKQVAQRALHRRLLPWVQSERAEELLDAQRVIRLEERPADLSRIQRHRHPTASRSRPA
ncbi:MAG TPA: hypothetical protein VFA20_24740 [Myxococcaceae bacterium]|nr:hypothetical protein [Myxococcaceae bacterium]